VTQLGDSLGDFSIGDFAANLIKNGAIDEDSSTTQPVTSQPVLPTIQSLPETDLDISDNEVSDRLMESILQRSFGLKGEVAESQVQEVPETKPQVGDLSEEVKSLKEDLASTVKQFTSILARMLEITEMVGIPANSTQAFGVSSAGPEKKTKRKKKRGSRRTY
jgi:hypothetical protein